MVDMGHGMRDWRVSLWNYFHYTRTRRLPLEKAVAEICEAGYGVELWPGWNEIGDLFDPPMREGLRALLRGVRSSWHSGGAKDFEGHKHQIDCAADVGSDVIVVHLGNLLSTTQGTDFSLARDVVAYARDHGISMCLENGPLTDIQRFLENVEGLMFCLDTGHTYLDSPAPGAEPAGLRPYLNAFKERLAHIHIQDCLPEGDHYTPGVGTIPREDWGYLLRTLEEVSFSGACVMEIQPLRPVRIAAQTVNFFSLLDSEDSRGPD